MNIKRAFCCNANVFSVLVVLVAVSVLYFIYYPEEQTPIVQLRDGQVRGIVQNAWVLSRKTVHFYQGIRYGSANRFEKPQPASPWTGVYEANNFQHACPQFGSIEALRVPLASTTSIQSEDCLFLNVWQPIASENEKQKLPVMVWIHGGGFQFGTIFSTIYDGKYIAQQDDVVVVSVNYRLGPLGFLYADKNLAPGNLGLHDQILALKWVQENIHNFGGDPNQVTIFGESAGSMSVGALILSPLAKGLFQRAIMQSGAPIAALYVRPKNKHIEVTKILAEKLDCPIERMKDTIDCLKNNRTLEQIQQIWMNEFTRKRYSNIVYGDDVLPVNPVEALRTGQIANKKIDLMYGVTRDEGSLFVLRILAEYEGKQLTVESAKHIMIRLVKSIGYSDEYATEVSNFYAGKLVNKNPTQDDLKSIIGHMWGDFHLTCPAILFAEEYAKVASPTNRYFAYRLMQPVVVLGLFGKPAWMGVTHAQDLFYLFMKQFAWFASSSHYQLSVDMIEAWTQFAKNGHPGRMGQVNWEEAFVDRNKLTKYMHFEGFKYEMVGNYFTQTCKAFWKDKILN